MLVSNLSIKHNSHEIEHGSRKARSVKRDALHVFSAAVFDIERVMFDREL